MTMSTKRLPLLLLAPVVLGAGLNAGATTPTAATRTIPPSVAVMEFPAAAGAMQRPPVEFEHEKHVTALQSEGCTACHARDERGTLVPQLAATAGIVGRNALIDAYHGACISCHERRAAASLTSGATTCGGCHVRREPGVPARAAVAFDYSLHARHAMAAQDKCEACHHVWDQAAQVLRYDKGKEEACRSCHGAADDGRNFSLANASHRSCVTCHLARAEAAEKGGPVSCIGCHDPAQQTAWVRLAEVPRLLRGQPDLLWVHGEGATFPAVSFDHRAHEPRASSCSGCHHRSLAACDGCHPLRGRPEGAGVTLAQAYHHGSSRSACVGCHAAATDAPECAGCHTTVAGMPADRSCRTCHSGPLAAEQVLAEPPRLTGQSFGALPAVSPDFPDRLVIEALVDEYEPSQLPHAKIVARLDAGARASSLANRFHGDTATLCAGCHHHSPPGVRPPACRSCHTEAADPVSDRPDLKVAYHRQCVGCHIRMGVPQQGCTDCHAVRGVAP
jgi:hypothetical protein